MTIGNFESVGGDCGFWSSKFFHLSESGAEVCLLGAGGVCAGFASVGGEAGGDDRALLTAGGGAEVCPAGFAAGCAGRTLRTDDFEEESKILDK